MLQVLWYGITVAALIINFLFKNFTYNPYKKD
jgi:hypothetical protein